MTWDGERCYQRGCLTLKGSMQVIAISKIARMFWRKGPEGPSNFPRLAPTTEGLVKGGRQAAG